MDLDTVPQISRAFARLVGVPVTDEALTEMGDDSGEVVNQYLTRGCRAAQRWLLKKGYHGWIGNHGPLQWQGEEWSGGRYAPLPADFLRAYGNTERSALLKSDGSDWGQEVPPEQSHVARGDVYWIPDTTRICLGRGATPPDPLHLAYHRRHPAINASTEIEFPVEARPLIVAEAAAMAREENWIPGGAEMYGKIDSALRTARLQALDIARLTKSQRTVFPNNRYGTRW
jgi:hypothetical protein